MTHSRFVLHQLSSVTNAELTAEMSSAVTLHSCLQTLGPVMRRGVL